MRKSFTHFLGGTWAGILILSFAIEGAEWSSYLIMGYTMLVGYVMGLARRAE